MMKNAFTFAFTLLLSLSGLHAQPVRLVKDLVPGPGSAFSSSFNPTDDGIVLSFDDKVLFITKNQEGAYRLWVSNGEEAGTFPLHEPAAGATFNNFLNEDDSRVYYSLETESAGHLYAVSRTTLDTTWLHSNPQGVSFLTFLNGQLYFAAENDLVRVDPVTQASEVVYSFGDSRSIKDIGLLNDQLIIIGGEANGTELYVSDGTTGGTQPYYQLNAGSDFSGDYYMTTVDDRLFFFYNRPSEPYILYVTDGTADGTQPLIELERITNADLERDRSVTGWNGRLFFRGREPGNGSSQDELFVSDGTPGGTFKIDISDAWAKPAFFTPYGNDLFFMADDGGFVFNVYQTDGTPDGTIKAIDAGALGGGISFGGNFMVAHQDSLYFYAFRSGIGEELWVSDGTTGGTRAIDIVPGLGSSAPTQMTSTDNYLFLIYASAEYGKELFVLDRDLVATTDLSAAGISVYPNPFRDHLVIDTGTDDPQLQTIELLDLQGQLLHRQAYNGRQIDLPALPPGAYYLRMTDGQRVYGVRVVKM